MGWNEEYGIYINKRWKAPTNWFPIDQKTKVLVVGPPNLYPMLARAPTSAQVTRMIGRFLANASEFAVNPAQVHGIPSIYIYYMPYFLNHA